MVILRGNLFNHLFRNNIQKKGLMVILIGNLFNHLYINKNVEESLMVVDLTGNLFNHLYKNIEKKSLTVLFFQKDLNIITKWTVLRLRRRCNRKRQVHSGTLNFRTWKLYRYISRELCPCSRGAHRHLHLKTDRGLGRDWGVTGACFGWYCFGLSLAYGGGG